MDFLLKLAMDFKLVELRYLILLLQNNPIIFIMSCM